MTFLIIFDALLNSALCWTVDVKLFVNYLEASVLVSKNFFIVRRLSVIVDYVSVIADNVSEIMDKVSVIMDNVFVIVDDVSEIIDNVSEILDNVSMIAGNAVKSVTPVSADSIARSLRSMGQCL